MHVLFFIRSSSSRVKDSKIPESEQISDIIINEEIVKSKLLRLKENKAPGPDGVSPKVLKRCADSLALPLAAFFRKSLSEMKLPTDWKKAEIVPIFKSGNRSEACNYRPISLTSILHTLQNNGINSTG